MKTSRKILSAVSAIIFVIGMYVYYRLQFSSDVRELLSIAPTVIKWFFGIAFFSVITFAGIIVLCPALKKRYSFALLIIPVFQRIAFLLFDLLGALACYDPSDPASVNFLSEEFTPYRGLMHIAFAVNVVVLTVIILTKRFSGKRHEPACEELAENM